VKGLTSTSVNSSHGEVASQYDLNLRKILRKPAGVVEIMLERKNAGTKMANEANEQMAAFPDKKFKV
jgi:mannose/fructose-specific phosphotransferase system component IIA